MPVASSSLSRLCAKNAGSCSSSAASATGSVEEIGHVSQEAFRSAEQPNTLSVTVAMRTISSLKRHPYVITGILGAPTRTTTRMIRKTMKSQRKKFYLEMKIYNDHEECTFNPLYNRATIESTLPLDPIFCKLCSNYLFIYLHFLFMLI